MHRENRDGSLGLGLLAVLLAISLPAGAQEIQISGKWATRVGVVRIYQEGKQITGLLIWASETCPFKRKERVLKGLLLEDSLSGQWRYCFKGENCQGDEWAPMVMLVARGGRVLSGAAHYKATKCQVGGKGKGDGLILRRLREKPEPSKPAGSPGAPDAGAPVTKAQVEKPLLLVDEEGKPLEEEIKPLDPSDYRKNEGSWRQRMEEAKTLMDRGFFERARREFMQASTLDPTRPEAFNGIGVSYYARGDYEEALNWYKKSLEVDSNFGDAYYNMACIYSLMRKNALAFRYLEIAVLNGFVEHEAMQQDPDLNNLRSDPQYRQILDKMRQKGNP